MGGKYEAGEGAASQRRSERPGRPPGGQAACVGDPGDQERHHRGLTPMSGGGPSARAAMGAAAQLCFWGVLCLQTRGGRYLSQDAGLWDPSPCTSAWGSPHSPWALKPLHFLLQGVIFLLQPRQLSGCRRHWLGRTWGGEGRAGSSRPWESPCLSPAGTPALGLGPGIQQEPHRCLLPEWVGGC